MAHRLHQIIFFGAGGGVAGRRETVTRAGGDGRHAGRRHPPSLPRSPPPSTRSRSVVVRSNSSRWGQAKGHRSPRHAHLLACSLARSLARACRGRLSRRARRCRIISPSNIKTPPRHHLVLLLVLDLVLVLVLLLVHRLLVALDRTSLSAGAGDEKDGAFHLSRHQTNSSTRPSSYHLVIIFVVLIIIFPFSLSSSASSPSPTIINSSINPSKVTKKSSIRLSSITSSAQRTSPLRSGPFAPAPRRTSRPAPSFLRGPASRTGTRSAAASRWRG